MFGKVGVGILEDALKLEAAWGIPVLGRTDIAQLASERGAVVSAPNLSPGLKTLANAILGVDLAKPKRVVMSNWACQRLSAQQVEYAALDAWMSRAIYVALEDGTWDGATATARGQGTRDDRLPSVAQEVLRVARKAAAKARRSGLGTKRKRGEAEEDDVEDEEENLHGGR